MIERKEYIDRRKRLAATLKDNSIAIIPSAEEVLRNGDAHYRFRQNSDFYYFTGFEEPDALLVIFSDGKSCLFNRVRDPSAEQWTGKRLGQEQAGETLGVDEAWPIDSLNEKLPELLRDKTATYYSFGHSKEMDKNIIRAFDKVRQMVRRGVNAPHAFYELSDLTSEMRLFKSKSEVSLMREAARISVAAHQRAMRQCKQLNNESELEAELLYEFARNGCRAPAYDPIVGSGENACILHYNENNQPLNSGDLVLIDAGGEYANYAADIIRTFPVNGQFSVEQKAIYELVLKAQKAGINKVKPGMLWNIVQQTMIQILTEGLVELGILKGKVDDLIESKAYQAFYMHNSGHWLGLDVHDVGSYKKNNEWRIFEPGMALTVEPGIYISANQKGVDSRWWNIGIRIEDDILVTENGHENLTEALAVEIDDIEALMRD